LSSIFIFMRLVWVTKIFESWNIPYYPILFFFKSISLTLVFSDYKNVLAPYGVILFPPNLNYVAFKVYILFDTTSIYLYYNIILIS